MENREHRRAFLVPFVVLSLAFLVSIPYPAAPAPPVAAGTVETSSGLHPVVNAGGCNYAPNASSSQTFPCSKDYQTTKYAYVGEALRLDLAVSSPDGSPINVTVWWDAGLNSSVYPFPAIPLNASAVNYSDVPATTPGTTTHLSFEWIYPSLSPNPIIGGKSSYYSVFVNLTGPNGYDPFDYTRPCNLPSGNCLFKVAVAINSPPQLSGVSNAYTITLPPPNPVIPPLELSASARDADNDPLVVTWNWDDGNVTVNRTGPAAAGVYVNVSHMYAFPLNVSPRNFYFHMRVSVDDGFPGHNTTTEVLIYYYVAYDGMPTNLRILSPIAGSHWQVGTTVPIEASFEEPEGEPMIYYFAFGDGNSSAPARLEHNGTVYSSHQYASPGEYELVLRVTDNATKELCLNLTANCTVTTSHWASIFAPIQVYINRAPIIALSVSSAPGVAGKEAGFAVAVLDKDADNLTVTWSFGDGTSAVNLTVGSNETVTLTQVHNYTHWGSPPSYTFTVTVWVDDGMGHNVTKSTEIFVGSENMPPRVSAVLLLTNNTVHANDTFALNITVSDPEGDSVWITVDWGDGDFWNGTNATMRPAVNYTFELQHAYTRVGNYTVHVNVTDGMVWVRRDPQTGALITLSHEVSVAAPVEVQAEPPPPPSEAWNWVDYTTLGIVLAIPVAFAIRAVARRRSERKED